MTYKQGFLVRYCVLVIWLCGIGVLFNSSTALAEYFAYKPYLSTLNFKSEAIKWEKMGYRPTDVSGYRHKGKDEYFGIWTKEEGPPFVIKIDMTSSQYQTMFNALKGKGFRLTHVSGFASGGIAKYAAIWEKKTGPSYVAKHNMSGTKLQNEFNKLKSRGYRPVHINGYSVARKPRFAAIWEKSQGPLYEMKHGMSETQFRKKRINMRKAGFELTGASGYEQSGKPRFVALWEKSAEPTNGFTLTQSKRNFSSAFWNRYYVGLRPVRIDPFSLNDGKDPYFLGIYEKHPDAINQETLLFIAKIVAGFRKIWNVRGVSLAITKDERLVFAQGYGLADEDQSWHVSPRLLFRIASVSKPITAIALMKLLEDNADYTLDSTVFGASGILKFDYLSKQELETLKTLGSLDCSQPAVASGVFLEQITIRHLLGHGSGLDDGNQCKDESDPMLDSDWELLSQTELINEYFDFEKYAPPQTQPGGQNVFEYSNFGYLLLGRIIEKLSGMTYENHVREMLAVEGIHDMHIAGDLKSDKRHNEVTYYTNEPNKSPYGGTMKVARMDAHGGWIASSIDLSKLLVRADGFGIKPDILSQSSSSQMTTVVDWSDNRGLGWKIYPDGIWHHGGVFRGSRAWVIRRPDRINITGALNTSTAKIGNTPLNAAFKDNVLTPIADYLEDNNLWPAYDLF